MAEVSKGAVGEILAARFLRDKGYTRSEGALFAPREAVTPSKQRRLLKTASLYLMQHPSPLQPRFDVIEIVTAAGSPMQVVQLDHLMDAFESGGLGAAF